MSKIKKLEDTVVDLLVKEGNYKGSIIELNKGNIRAYFYPSLDSHPDTGRECYICGVGITESGQYSKYPKCIFRIESGTKNFQRCSALIKSLKEKQLEDDAEKILKELCKAY